MISNNYMKVINFNIFVSNISEDSNIIFLGKGPSFSLIQKINLDNFYTVCLNHTILNVDKCDISSIIDIENFFEAGKEIEQKAKYLAMPFRPHVKEKDFKPTDKTILDFAKEDIYLDKMLKENRVLTYNTNSGIMCGYKPIPQLPNNDLYINNGDSLFGIFARCLKRNSNRVIYSIGLDGGNSYSEEFEKFEVGGNITGVSYSQSIQKIYEFEKSYNYKMIFLQRLIKK